MTFRIRSLVIMLVLTSCSFLAEAQYYYSIDEALENPDSVKMFYIEKSDTFPNALLKLENLETLYIYECSYKSFPLEIKKLLRLKHIIFEGAEYIPKNISKISSLVSLTIIDQVAETKINFPAELKENKKLIKLSLFGVYPSSGVKYLERVKLFLCKGAELEQSSFISDLKHLRELQWLAIGETDLTSLPVESLVNLDSLRQLDLFYNSELVSIEGISRLKQLERVNISGSKISNFRELCLLPELKQVDIERNKQISLDEEKYLRNNIKAEKVIIK